jgi:hypothetical protein
VDQDARGNRTPTSHEAGSASRLTLGRREGFGLTTPFHMVQICRRTRFEVDLIQKPRGIEGFNASIELVQVIHRLKLMGLEQSQVVARFDARCPSGAWEELGHQLDG